MLHNWEFSNEIPADLSIEDYENLRFRFEIFLFIMWASCRTNLEILTLS